MAFAQNFGHSELDEAEDGQNAGFDVGADAHDRTVELLGTDLTQRFGVRRVGGDDMSEFARQTLDDVHIFVAGQHFVAESDG